MRGYGGWLWRVGLTQKSKVSLGQVGVGFFWNIEDILFIAQPTFSRQQLTMDTAPTAARAQTTSFSPRWLFFCSCLFRNIFVASFFRLVCPRERGICKKIEIGYKFCSLVISRLLFAGQETY